MRKLTVLTWLLIPILSYSQFENKKTYNIQKCSNPPKIDGIVNEQEWSKMESAKDFTQLTPDNGRKERNGLHTEVKICYDDIAIYFGVTMKDPYPDSILTELSKRDESGKNVDEFGIWIDPYNDGQLSYNFLVSAAGIQTDAKYTNNSNDGQWDVVWKSEVNINKNGWSAEFAIPFSVIRFPKGNDEWSLNMSRGIRRHREYYTWNFIDVNYDNYSAQNGILKFNKFDVKPPLRLSIMPYATTYYNNYDGNTTFPYNIGTDLKYGISESFTLDMTLVPDFGQVPPDDKVLNLSPYEVYYSEKRQFFTEGTELFNKAEELFYTRRVSDDLINASKITGRAKNGLGIGVLNAISTDLENYNVMILDQSLKNNSSLSFVNTNTFNNTITSNSSSISTRLNNKKNTYRINTSIKNSNVFENNNLSSGFAGNLMLEKTKGTFTYELVIDAKDDKYNTNNLGYLRRNNEVDYEVEFNYEQINPNTRFVSSNASLSTHYKTLYNPLSYTELFLYYNSTFTFHNYLTLGINGILNPIESIDYFEARTLNGGMTADLENPFNRSKKFGGRAFISTDYRKDFAIDISVGGNKEPLYGGKQFRWRISPLYRFNDHFSIRYVLSVRDLFNDVGYVTNDSFENPVFSLRNTEMITNVFSGSYILNNKMDFSFKLRYHFDQVENLNFKSLEDDGYLTDSDYEGDHNINYTTWTANIQYNWWFAPGSQISVVWNNAISNYDNIIRNQWIDNVEQTLLLPQENSFSVKLIYYLDYLYLQKKK